MKREARPDSAAESSVAVLTKDGKLYEDPLLRCGLLLAACNDQPKPGETRPGDSIALDLIRAGGNRETVTVTLGERPDTLEMEQGRPQGGGR